MAKGKHAAALFEVIHSNKRFDARPSGAGGRTRSILRTPKWWFKRARGGAPAAVEAPMANSTPPDASHSTSPGAGGIQVNVDPDGQHVTFRLSYTAAAIVTFTIGVTVVLAYLAGQQMRGEPAGGPVISSASTSQLQSQPPRPSVLDITRPRSASASSSESASMDIEEPAGDDGTIAAPQLGALSPAWNDPKPPATLVVDGAARNIGLNYVVVQSYADEKLATEATNVLKSNGIDCTIERGLKGWPAAWHIVVGTRGFDRISSDAFKDYVKKIQTVSKIFAPKGGYKAFQPTAYKWDREK